ncbi:MAG TPA: UDP-N-acetylenolpyruvoylglucosamine reductase [Solibacterales bacterium]|nr:UDP-N-acetylenolpyruvoylglucosamine reductase [Bryobacterales bacterium]
MSVLFEARSRFHSIPSLTVRENALLSGYTRFGIGGPADLFCESSDQRAFTAALAAARESGLPHVVIGGGTNLVVSDEGFRGVVLRYTATDLHADGTAIAAAAGGELQAVVDFSIGLGLQGLETMTGIPGSLGAAIYGNAGAYGHSISERVESVRFFDGSVVREIPNQACEFRYRESTFKRNKEWVILSARLAMTPASEDELRRTADEILQIRNQKYPPTMRCAGSIFKNLILAELPEGVASRVPAKVIREGKVPSAYFLEQVGAKGLRNGGIRVADYHANLIYNEGFGTARELRSVIEELKTRVRDDYGLLLEEEVQYIGF